MKSLFLVFVSLIFIIILNSCSDDNPTQPNYNSILKGTWTGYYVNSTDSIYYEAGIDEYNGIISGTANFFGKTVIPYGSGTITQTSERKGTINGNYNKPSIKIEFPNDTTYFFVGNLSPDSTKIVGKIELINEFTGAEYKYDLELKKK